MRVALLALSLLLAPLALAAPEVGTDCGPDTVADGCSAWAYASEQGATAACAASSGHSHGASTGPALGCFAGGRDGFAFAGCSESRWQSDPYSEDVLRACGAGAGSGGAGAFASCSEGSSRSPSRNVTWHECFLTGLAASGGASGSCARNGTDPNTPCGDELVWASTGDLDGDGAPDDEAACDVSLPEPRWPFETEGGCAARLRAVVLNAGFYCERQLPSPGSSPTEPCGGDVGASSRNGSYPFDPDVRDNGAALQCSLNLTGGSGSDPNGGCGDGLTADLDGDGAPDAACRSEGNITKKQKQWLPANFRCSAGGDDDGDGAPDTAVGCESDGIAIDHEGVQRCKWYVPDMDGDGDLSASLRNQTYTAIAHLSDGSSQDLRCAPPREPGAAGPDAPACTTATKWKVYAPLPNAFTVGSCTGGTDGARASCEWVGTAGSGSVAHDGLPPRHSNVVLADVDGDGAADVLLVESGGSAFVLVEGCAIAVKPGAVPTTRGCIA